MPNIGGGVERTSAELRLRRPGWRIIFLECSRRLWHGYSWGVEAYLRAAPPHCLRDTLNTNRQYTFRGSTDHHPSPCVLRSRGLAVPLLRPLQCAFYVVALRGNDHRSSSRSRSSTVRVRAQGCSKFSYRYRYEYFWVQNSDCLENFAVLSWIVFESTLAVQ